MELEAIQNRIAELEAGKAALIKHAGDLESQRDEVSTFETLIHIDSKGAKKLDSLITELVTIAAKCTAFDAAIRAERANLVAAERAANVEQDQRNAQAALQIVEGRFAENGKALQAAMDLLESAAGDHDVIFAELEALGCSVPDTQRRRINGGFALATTIMRTKWQRQVGTEFLAPHQRTSFEKV
jgi:hypothetical protein